MLWKVCTDPLVDRKNACIAPRPRGTRIYKARTGCTNKSSYELHVQCSAANILHGSKLYATQHTFLRAYLATTNTCDMNTGAGREKNDAREHAADFCRTCLFACACLVALCNYCASKSQSARGKQFIV